MRVIFFPRARVTLNRVSIFVGLINKLLKHSKTGNPNTTSIFYGFTPNPNLCPMTCIQEYFWVTQPLRNSSSGALFLSFVEPHRPVTKQSLTRWVKVVLVKAGIEGFSAHSTRGAASSKAFSKGISLQDILVKGNWSNKSTFEKFYNRSFISPTQRFQNAILNPLWTRRFRESLQLYYITFVKL